jgi:hypothetical protein
MIRNIFGAAARASEFIALGKHQTLCWQGIIRIFHLKSCVKHLVKPILNLTELACQKLFCQFSLLTRFYVSKHRLFKSFNRVMEVK